MQTPKKLAFGSHYRALDPLLLLKDRGSDYRGPLDFSPNPVQTSRGSAITSPETTRTRPSSPNLSFATARELRSPPRTSPGPPPVRGCRPAFISCKRGVQGTAWQFLCHLL